MDGERAEIDEISLRPFTIEPLEGAFDVQPDPAQAALQQPIEALRQAEGAAGVRAVEEAGRGEPVVAQDLRERRA